MVANCSPTIPAPRRRAPSYAIPPIPANGQNYELIGLTAYRSPITIYQLQPHAHVRAVDFRYAAIYPDGHEQVILTVPHYSYHFQLEYALATPLALPAGSKIIVRAHYDNSTNNDHLRDLGANDAARRCGPENVAFFGRQNQSWDEMFTPFIQYSADERPAERLDLVSAVGCLAHEPSGRWRLGHGSEAMSTSTQGTSSTELAASSAAPFGGHQYELLGIDVFNPAQRVGNKVVAKGVLIPTPQRRSHQCNLAAVDAIVLSPMKRPMALHRSFPIAAAAVLQSQAAVAAASYRLTEWPAAAPQPDFQLVDMNGHRRSIRDYAGGVSIVFFGYTHCPDVCPTELLELSQVVRTLGPLASQVQVLFVSLDPERDTPELLKDYVTSFDPRFIGLTGSNAEINAAAASFSVQFAKVSLGNDYTIDHSTGSYVIDRTGRLRLVGTLQNSLDDWTEDLQNPGGRAFSEWT